MSKTVPCSVRGHEFWAYDVALSVLAATLLRQARDESNAAPDERLRSEAIGKLRAAELLGANSTFCIGDGDEDLIGRLPQAVAELQSRSTLTQAEVLSWQVLEDAQWRPLFRADGPIATAPSAALGEAILRMWNGTMPQPPSGSWWFIGTESPDSTIRMNGP